MQARAFQLLIALLVLMASGPAGAVECWTGWGYWVDPWTQGYKSERLLLATKGPASWAWGRSVTLHVLDETEGGIDQRLPPLTVFPGKPRISTRQGLTYVTALASVQGQSDFLTFGLSHIEQTAFGLSRLDRFYRWACGLSKSRD